MQRLPVSSISISSVPASSFPLDWREFHVSRESRDRYEFPHALFATNGHVVFADFRAARSFAQKINDKRQVALHPEHAVKAGQLNALGLLDEVMHHLIAQYRAQQNPQVWAQAMERLEAWVGRDQLDLALHLFIEQFPPLAIYQGEISVAKYLEGETGGQSHREIALEEMLILWLENANPAAAPYRELFNDFWLESETAYPSLLLGLHQYFDGAPKFGPNGQSLIEVLRAPARAHPDSLTAQLEWILQHWGDHLEPYFYRMLQSLDFVKEEEKPVFFGPGPALVPDYRSGANRGARRRDEAGIDEPEAFSADKDWMPRAVLLAKNAYVWLEQLSREYGREIHRLDQVPGAELDRLGAQGFSGLWLIGLWERSRASKQIKQLCGNDAAVASAYSLLSYEIADDLGGWPALETLRWQAWQRGIRLASDMVPNHMGIDSDWVFNHPDWFLSLPDPPFPTYTFNGPNLSTRDGVGIFLEDHYYDKTDAAVVFKRVDFHNGDTRYIYHGNDGTSMPWNDTAQLNYLMQEVREGVIQTILHVARNFPIIRFDAAMTLAKKHYQRLWFPEPGTGGDIASRAEHGLTFDEFEAAFPVEFWREVVDRVATEVPDTLLLAEAFWMMEGYFVRTLGMHRVYNSAFMNMLRDEENANYRLTMKNTLEFDPEILKRFVNFMNNPDERTAIDQFGAGDKYFGIATLMCTLPGLPMFGHGQIEGFTEKYGMEYRQAKWHEMPDRDLIARHEREIFPLLHRRHIFAEVDNFTLYDFWQGESVNEDVFAFSNRAGAERALVVYHNRFAQAKGWIKTSVGAIDKGARRLRQSTLGAGLGVQNKVGHFALFRDLVSGLEYIRPAPEICEQGLYLELNAYDRHVFLDWREVADDESKRWSQLCARLEGRGVQSLAIALREWELRAVLAPLRELLNAPTLRALMPTPQFAIVDANDQALRIPEPQPSDPQPVDAHWLDDIERRIEAVAEAIAAQTAGETKAVERTAANATEALSEVLEAEEAGISAEELAREIRQRLEFTRALADDISGEAGVWVRDKLSDSAAWSTLLGWTLLGSLGKIQSRREWQSISAAWLDDRLFARVLDEGLRALNIEARAVQHALEVVTILTLHQNWWQDEPTTVLSKLFGDETTRVALGVNRWNEVWWFDREAWEDIAAWLCIAAIVSQSTLLASGTGSADNQGTLTLATRYSTIFQVWCDAAETAEYQVEKLVGNMQNLSNKIH